MKNNILRLFKFERPMNFSNFFILALGICLGTSWVAAAGPNSGRMQPAPSAAANQGAAQANGGRESSAAEPPSLQTMNQKLLQYNEMSRRVHDRRFRGAADEDQLKVATALPKPERGTIGSQMQAQDNQERNQEQNDDTSGDQTHD